MFPGRTTLRVLQAVFLVLFCASSFALEPPPFNPQHKLVTDYTGTLSESQQTQLVSRLAQIEKTDGTQIAVLIIPTLQGDELFNFAQNTFQKWGIGQKDKNSGVLFLIVKNDKQMRIHVGYGLEGRLTDLESDQILRNVVRPAFREGKFYEGIDAAAAAIVKSVQGEYKAPAQQAAKSEESKAPIIFFILFMMILIWQIKNNHRGMRGGRRGGWSSGPTFGGWGGGGGGFGGGGFSGGGGFGGGSSGGGGASSSW